MSSQREDGIPPNKSGQRNRKKNHSHYQQPVHDYGLSRGQNRMSYSQLKDQHQYRPGYDFGYGSHPGSQQMQQHGREYVNPYAGREGGMHTHEFQQGGAQPHYMHQRGPYPIGHQSPYNSQHGQQGGRHPYEFQQGTQHLEESGGQQIRQRTQQRSGPGQGQAKDNPGRNKTPKKPKQNFEPYWQKEAVQEGLKKGTLIEGPIRINPKNYTDAYIPHPNGHTDIYISGMTHRNRALNGDVVAVLLYGRDDWKVNVDNLAESAEELGASIKQVCLSSKEGEDKDKHETDRSSENDATKIDDTASRSDNGEQSDLSLADSQTDTSSTKTTPAVISQHQRSSAQGARPKHEKKSIGKGAKQENAPTKKKNYTSVADIGGDMKESVPDGAVQPTAKVVYIIEKKHSRACTGFIRPVQDKNPDVVLFSPMDNRLPRILVPSSDCPKDFLERPQDHEKTLFIAQITDWPETSKFAKGQLRRSLGEAGQIEPETDGMLIEYDVDSSEFSDQVIACLPQDLPWRIPPEEIRSRKDFRNLCIFSIDPATARDLDDALSCVSLGNGRYEIGVHIADVSYFIQSGNALDKVASERATSTYLVQKVIPMLPRLLCEQLCSLNPDEDRLTFSVVWTITENGQIESEWFGRSIIRSCVKLSYDHAQGFIEDPTKEWTVDELPPISDGYTLQQIKNTVLQLQEVAKNLRQQRFENGALRLDQVKLQFALDKESGLPCGYTVYQQRDSNRLIEEFMLLANMAVARKIYEHFPQIAILRRHPEPQSRMIDDLGSLCRQLGVPIDVTSSKTIQESLSVYSGGETEDQAKLLILTALCSKPMQNARYFCTGVIEDLTLYRHYALNVPFYTHFTSPIRRYPDIMVHRLLGAALGYGPPPDVEKGELQKEAEHCNDKKTAAKRVSDLSNQLYFSVFVKECGPLEEQGMVMGVLDKAFDVLVLKLGVINRVYLEKLPLLSFKYQKDKKMPTLSLIWKRDELHSEQRKQQITIFSSVNCRLMADPDALKWHIVTLHPDDDLASENPT